MAKLDLKRMSVNEIMLEIGAMLSEKQLMYVVKDQHLLYEHLNNFEFSMGERELVM